MIVKENIEIGGTIFVKQYSDGGFYIERDGEKYSEAIDPEDIPRAEDPDGTVQKAAAFDYLTGRSTANE